MAFILTPRFAPAYLAPQCNPFGFCAPVTRPSYSYRISRPQPRRPQYSSFSHFFNQVDELLSEIDHEATLRARAEAQIQAQREAHRQRQQRKRALRAKFAVNQNEQGWQIHGDIQGFNQENISIEIIDENTLKISGNTEWQAESQHAEARDSANPEPSVGEEQSTEEVQSGNLEGVTPASAEIDHLAGYERTTTGRDTPDSDTESRKSYQATVEDDFEDLGAEVSSLISASSGTSTPSEPKESKDKEPAVEETVAVETVATPQSTHEASASQQQEKTKEDERIHGSFERTFKFPERIHVDDISASFREGTLTVTVPKGQVMPVRRIAIL